MKNTILITRVLVLVPLLATGLTAETLKRFDAKEEVLNQGGYLRFFRPAPLTYQADAIPADRRMLISSLPPGYISPDEAAKLEADIDALVDSNASDIFPVIEANATASDPFATAPIIVPPSPVLPMEAPAVSLVTNPGLSAGVVDAVSTDELLRILERNNPSGTGAGPRVYVPFEVPFSSSPANIEIRSRARYERRFK